MHRAAVTALARRPHDRFFLYVHYMDAHDFGYRDVGYAEAVAEVDAAVGALLAHLERLDLADDTVVVFTADHGEHLGERHPPMPRRVRRSHLGNPSYEELLQVPLIVAPVPPPGAGLAGVRRSQDLHRFLRRLAGARPGPTDPVGADELFLSERSYRTYVRGRFKSAFQRGSNRLVLFDLEADPGEQRDVADAHPEVVAAHRKRVAALSARLAAAPGARRGPTEADRERLRALGYLE